MEKCVKADLSSFVHHIFEKKKFKLWLESCILCKETGKCVLCVTMEIVSTYMSS